jgi:hypothetical protein
VAKRLDLDRDSAASLVRQVARCLSVYVEAHKVRHLVQKLPREMKGISRSTRLNADWRPVLGSFPNMPLRHAAT